MSSLFTKDQINNLISGKDISCFRHRQILDACSNGEITKLYKLLKNGQSLNVRYFGVSPLHVACMFGQEELVAKLLEEEGLDVNFLCSNGHKASEYASAANHVDILEILKAVELSKKPQQPPTREPIARVVSKKRDTPAYSGFEGVSMSLDDLCAGLGQPAIANNAGAGGPPEIQETKPKPTKGLKFEEDIKTYDGKYDKSFMIKDFTPEVIMSLPQAAKMDDCVKVLIDGCIIGDRGVMRHRLARSYADINEKYFGLTLLHMACILNRPAIVELLLEKGANAQLKADNGSRPLYFACKSGSKMTVSILVEFIQYELEGCVEDVEALYDVATPEVKESLDAYGLEPEEWDDDPKPKDALLLHPASPNLVEERKSTEVDFLAGEPAN